jgi:hypothetical protein
MDPTPTDTRDDPERAPAAAFQSEDGEHVRSATAAHASHTDTGPAAAYQREDGEPAA